MTMMVSGFGCCFSICSPVAPDMPLLTNHLNLQRLALQGNVIPVLCRFPLFAPSSLVSIRAPFLRKSLKISESEWKAVDLALCDPKFPHLKSVEFTISHFILPLENPHAFFQQLLPTCYERGMLWYRHRYEGSYLL